MLLERTMIIPAERHRVFSFFGDPGNLSRITPAWLDFRIVSAPARELREGDRIEYRIRLLGFPVRWVTRIVSWVEGESFVDLQEKGPYALWRHLHSFDEIEGGVRMTDRVEYEVPFGVVGWWLAGWWIRRRLDEIFAYREQVIRARFDPALEGRDGADGTAPPPGTRPGQNLTTSPDEATNWLK